MWISKAIFEQSTKERLEAQAVRDALQQHNAQLAAHIEWMRIRLTQVETERAQMIWNYTGVKVPVPQIIKDETPSIHMPMPDFADMGDAEASKLGITWNPDGSVSHNEQ